MRECVLTTAVILALATPPITAASTTPFQLAGQGGVVVPVTLSGTGPFMMLLDTGATHSVITDRVATALEARAIAKSNVISATATLIRPVVAVERWSLGPITIDVVLPTVVPDSSFDGESNIDGLIGQDVLGGLRYTIDFKRRVVVWHDGTPAPHGVELTLSFDHGRFLVALPHEHETLRLVPDSGTGAIVLFEVAGRMPLQVLETGQTVELASVNASGAARHVKIRELRVGSRRYRGVTAVVIPRPDHDPAEGDGLLPLHVFEQVTFDGPARRLFLG
jgi:predicted aspartyl protease